MLTSIKRRHDERRNDKTTNDERGNDKTTPPYGKIILRPGGMRVCALNPPPPFRGTGVQDTTTSPASSSFRPPRTVRRATPKMQIGTTLKPQNVNLFDFRPALAQLFRIFARSFCDLFFASIFFDFWIHFGSILGQVLVTLASFWHPFFKHRFCTDLWLIFH